MNEKTPKPKPDPVTTPQRLDPQGKFNPAFDTWLETKLHKIFDDVASQPLPDDLVNLLKKIDQADTPKKKG